MTLLDTIAAAAAAADSGALSTLSTFPIVLNPGELHPDPDPNPNLQTLTPATWKLSSLDSDLTSLIADSIVDLSKKLRNPKKPLSSPGPFVSVLNSFFKKVSFKTGITVQSHPNPKDPLDLNFTLAAVEKLGFAVVPEISALVAECCARFDLWEVLKVLVAHNFVKNLNSFNLVEKLAEKNRAELLCLCVTRIPNLRASDIYAILKFFLSPTKDSYDAMVGIRKEWERQALLAVEMATSKDYASKKGSHLSRAASLLLMMAHDNFHSSEICLHYLFATNIDDLVLSSAVSKLNGFEVLNLVRYFLKWLEKYERFPEARPCYKAGEVLGLTACNNVPPLESVVRGLGLVLDEHFSYLVLNPEVRDELEAARRVVGSLALEADLCCPVDDIIKHLKSGARENMEVDR
ncbi:uncharacterized protein M6B38_158275 [Iris pallida]|uniref:Uncharacterized protein n=1 Tax=Iris pallida TaxID=29817 RepID=A0AAX6F200_IRIPA|nr:uncharacterized protein M6B38_158275 [Iris pallida]